MQYRYTREFYAESRIDTDFQLIFRAHKRSMGALASRSLDLRNVAGSRDNMLSEAKTLADIHSLDAQFTNRVMMNEIQERAEESGTSLPSRGDLVSGDPLELSRGYDGELQRAWVCGMMVEIAGTSRPQQTQGGDLYPVVSVAEELSKAQLPKYGLGKMARKAARITMQPKVLDTVSSRFGDPFNYKREMQDDLLDLVEPETQNVLKKLLPNDDDFLGIMALHKDYTTHF